MERKCFHVFILLYFSLSQFPAKVQCNYLQLYGTRGTQCKSSLLISCLCRCCGLKLNTAATISHCIQTLTKIVVITVGKPKLLCNRATFQCSEVRLQCNACLRFSKYFQRIWLCRIGGPLART